MSTPRAVVHGLSASALAALFVIAAPAFATSDTAAPTAPSTYVVGLVSTAATGIAMNERGSVAGTRVVDAGCTPPCLGDTQTVVWRGTNAIELSGPPGFAVIEVKAINSAGWVAGNASPSFPGIDTHAVVWKPVGGGYQAIDLGVLPGTTKSTAAGIDDANRVVGYSSTQFFPPAGAPFLWTEAGGMVDLTALGFPAEGPVAISRGGTVALNSSWYRLDDPASLTDLAPVPAGFLVTNGAAVINDAGDQGRFLTSTGAENLVYLFRYAHDGVWQQLSPTGTGHLATWGLGSINTARDVSATVLSAGVIAYGPDGAAESVNDKLAPSYGGGDVTNVGPVTDAGVALAQVLIGNSKRLVRLLPAEPCVAGCAIVSSLEMFGRFVDDPGNPGQCTQLARNVVVARIQVTDEGGNAVAGARIRGHFMDDYWLDKTAITMTDANGFARLRYVGPACVGAIAFLATDMVVSGRTFDRTRGTLADYVIPLP